TLTSTLYCYTLSLHAALPISAAPTPSEPPVTITVLFLKSGSIRRVYQSCRASRSERRGRSPPRLRIRSRYTRESFSRATIPSRRSEEHTSELQSRENLVCRLL